MPSFTFAPIVRCPSLPRAATTLVLLALGLTFGDCASSASEFGDSMTKAFANPSTYDFYDCKQLQSARKDINTHIDETKRLMAKAETGFGGAVVAEMVYRQDYIAYLGQLKYIDEYWARNKCVEVTDDPKAPAAPVVLSGKKKGKGQGGGPGASAIH
jgi:hypothetical protein